MTRAILLVLLVALGGAAPTQAQVRAGGEFRVNTYTTGNQYAPAAAFERDGDFVVVWTSTFGVFNEADVIGQRYEASGAPRGGEFTINTYTTGRQYVFAAPSSVASRPDGRFVVVWTSAFQDGDLGGIFAQRFDANGNKAGAEFQVNTTTTGSARVPSVALSANGTFVVVWTNALPSQPNDVFGQMFDATGRRLGTEFRINSYTPGYQVMPRVAMDGAANFVVVWRDGSGHDGSGLGVFGQRFAADGSPFGAEFQVNTATAGDQVFSGLGGAADGRFVVTWDSPGDGSGRGIFGQRYDATGSLAGPQFQINQSTTGDQFENHVGMDENGNFVASWRSPFNSGGIRAQRFGNAGVLRGPEFRANSFAQPAYYGAVTAVDHVGNVIVSWSHSNQDGSSYGAFAQRFGGLVPKSLAVDTIQDGDSNGNAVLEPGERVDVRPGWRNVNGAAQNGIGGGLTITGPGSPTVLDGVATYGNIAQGATQTCTECYEVMVGNPLPRPTHWDLSATESITPDIQGQEKIWRMHVGGSFTDVDPGSNFYRFVETLLHHRITGGCTAARFCPSAPTSREQMAVLLLVSKEGSGYAPPACGAAMFNDVPANSPFCRWVEELVRRGVVGGCGGGNYCPASSVTREQLSVFVLRTLDSTIDPPPCTPPNTYADVPESSPFCRWIEELTNRGVVTGCGGGNFCPASPVARDQVSTFISMTFGLTLYGP